MNIIPHGSGEKKFCAWSVPQPHPCQWLLCFSIRLLQLQRSVLSPDSDLPDELLYGRAGYLYALLYVNKEIGADTVDEDTITKVRLAHVNFLHIWSSSLREDRININAPDTCSMKIRINSLFGLELHFETEISIMLQFVYCTFKLCFFFF